MNENYGINPNLYGYPANNAYLGQNNFVTIPQPVQRKPILSGGRMVMQESDIRPNEVPNNGNLAVFVQEDLENVYLKTWTGSGTIATNVYRRHEYAILSFAYGCGGCCNQNQFCA